MVKTPLTLLLLVTFFVTVTVAQSLNSELARAAKEGDTTIVRALLAKGANVNAKESSEQLTALISAAAMGHVETVEALLNAGADINAKNTRVERL